MMWERRRPACRIDGLRKSGDEIPSALLSRPSMSTDCRSVSAVDGQAAAVAGLADEQVEVLALALHRRWHGDHRLGVSEVACARISGAFDDVAAIQPLIVGLIRGGAS